MRAVKRPYILGIGGTLSPESSSERLLRLALKAAEAQGADTKMLHGGQLVMPAYDPHDPVRTENAARLVREFAICDGLIISSPGYHGSLSGLIKNALDYAEDLRSADQVYFDGKAFGCIGCGAGWQGAAATVTALRSVAHALQAWPTPMGVVANSTERLFDDNGACESPKLARQLEILGGQVVEFARMKRMAALEAMCVE